MVMLTVNKIGRRGLIYLGLGIQVVCELFVQIGIITSTNWFCIFMIYIFIFGFSISLGGTLYIYQTEILPPEVIPFTNIVQWILTFLVSFQEFNEVSNDILFMLNFLFFVTSLAGCFIFQGYSVETKGKSESRILSAWKYKTFSF
jgi:hypothetical protein